MKQTQNETIANDAAVFMIDPRDLTLVHEDHALASTLYVPSRLKTDNQAGWKEFVESISNGIINPLTVFETKDEYVVAAGRRRLLAAIEAGLPLIPIRIYEYNDDLAFQVMVEENSQRLDDDFMTKVDLVKRLQTRKYSYAKIAKLFGVTHQTIRDWEAISLLPDVILQHLNDGYISTTVALKFTTIDSEAEQIKAFDKLWSLVEEGKKPTVAQADKVTKDESTGKIAKPTTKQLRNMLGDRSVPVEIQEFIQLVLGDLSYDQLEALSISSWFSGWPTKAFIEGTEPNVEPKKATPPKKSKPTQKKAAKPRIRKATKNNQGSYEEDFSGEKWDFDDFKEWSQSK